MNQLQQLAHSYIMDAIKAKTQCMIHMEDIGISMYSYQDRLGIHCRLELYMSNYGNIDGTTGLRWIMTPYQQDEIEGGSLFINWELNNNVSVTQYGDRILLKIGGLVINFLTAIKIN